MRNYELLYILPASLTSEEIVQNFQEVQGAIEKLHAKMLTTLLEHPFLTKTGISKEEESEAIRAIPVVKRKLAYSIKHEKFGFYCLVNFESEEKHLKEIDEYLRLNNKVLRHIITVADPMTKEEFERLQTLFARKKAEQDKEEAEKESGKAKKEEAKRYRKAEEKTEVAPEVVLEEKEEAKAEKATKETEGDVTVEEKAEEKSEKEEVKKEDKKASKKSKIKLEDLEDKLDAILEDTIV
jgi:ribosomal protein S6